VLRVGAAPTSKALVGWLDATVPQVLVDPDGTWPGPGGAAAVRLAVDPSALLTPVAATLGDSSGRDAGWLDGWASAERAARGALDRLVDGWDEPFEGRVARDLVAALPDGATLVVGSSMPVRDIDAFARPRDGLAFVANRGASGIDGFVATALGVAAVAGGPVAAEGGDLTFLHDATSVLGAGRRPEAVSSWSATTTVAGSSRSCRRRACPPTASSSCSAPRTASTWPAWPPSPASTAAPVQGRRAGPCPGQGARGGADQRAAGAG
jgi:2-succinyl-5-enolpyruvyl-6-hydroxy-3-cyclohexene-1-carboxylate synthase